MHQLVRIDLVILLITAQILHLLSVGADFSDDMLNYSKTKNNKKLNLKKKDLINEKCDDEADLVLIIRMLNLFETKTSLKIIDNILPSAKNIVLHHLDTIMNIPLLKIKYIYNQ